MMKFAFVGAACMAAASTLTLAGPQTAPVTFDETVPAALVSQDGLQHRALGEMLFGALPTDHQVAIAEAGGIGPRERSLLGVGVLLPQLPSEWSGDITEIIDAQTLATMRPEHLAMFESLTRMSRLGEPIPAMCLAPDTDPKVAQAFHAFFEAIQGSNERYQYGDRWSRTATDGTGLVIGQPTTLRYSYVPDGTQIPDLGGTMRNSNLHAWLNGLYGAGTWEGLFDLVFARWSYLSGLSYVYEPNDDGVGYTSNNTGRGIIGIRGDCRIGATNLDGNSGVLAFNYFPDYGDMVIDSNDTFFNSSSQNYRRFRNVVAHEHGHGIGAAHVCPANSTKLMEPFITTTINGPQLDDTLFAQRAYGDNLEDNDTLGTATPMGSMNPGNPYSFNDASIDDNADLDFFEFTVTLPVEITVSLTPAAASYLNGPQLSSGFCSAGTTKNYQTIHDLVIEFQDDQGSVLATINNSAAGVVETGSHELFAPGTYYVRISGDASNDVQLYDIDVSSALTVAPMLFDLIVAPGDEVAPDTSSTITTTVDLRDDTFVAAPDLQYSIDGGALTTLAMSDLGGGVYESTLPAMPCGSSASYQVRAEGVFAGPVVIGPFTTFSTLGVARAASFEDNFETDQGWTVSGSLTISIFGMWEREVPTSDTPNGPPSDGDGSGTAWVTGNESGFVSHVSGGDTILTSPSLDMSGKINPVINVKTWFNDSSGQSPSVNEFILELSNDNGSTWANLDTFGPGNADAVGGWIDRAYIVADTLAPTSTMRFRAVAEDANGANFYEAGIDGFSVEDADCDSGCPADLNGDGIVDNGDIGSFVTLFLAGDLAADFNGDGILDNGDIGAFIDAFLAGC